MENIKNRQSHATVTVSEADRDTINRLSEELDLPLRRVVSLLIENYVSAHDPPDQTTKTIQQSRDQILKRIDSLIAIIRDQEKKSSQPASQIAPDLLTRITSLMEEEQLFRQKDLRMGDLASRLGTNSTYVSACLNNQLGVSFPSFVAKYRVEYAQRLMRDNPEKTLSLIAEESGFATEANFFRTFKQLTGVTPKEWRDNANNSW